MSEGLPLCVVHRYPQTDLLSIAGKSSIKAPDGAPEEGAIVQECLEMQKSLLQVPTMPLKGCLCITCLS